MGGDAWIRPLVLVVTSTVRGRIAALFLGLLVVFGGLGLAATHVAGTAGSRRPASSFIEQLSVSVAAAEAAPTESGLGRSHHAPPLAFFVIVGCALAGSVRRRRAIAPRASLRQLEQFFALRRGPPVALLVR